MKPRRRKKPFEDQPVAEQAHRPMSLDQLATAARATGFVLSVVVQMAKHGSKLEMKYASEIIRRAEKLAYDDAWRQKIRNIIG